MLNTEKIREIMKMKELNTSQLAKKIGISPQHLSNILSGARGISTESLKALTIALEADVVDILDDTSQGGTQPTISIRKDGGIVVEKTSCLRITLPANVESYDLVKRLITENEELNNKIQTLLLKSDKKAKEKILKMLENFED